MASRGINKVILIGHLGQDPEIRYMPNGNAVANISLATSEIWKDKNTGENKERTEWHRVVIFSKLAEIAREYLKKGSQIYIEGTLQTRKWQDQQGIERYITEVIVNIGGTMQMLGNRNTSNVLENTINHNDKFIKKNTLNKVDKNLEKKRYSKQSSLLNEDAESEFDDEIPF